MKNLFICFAGLFIFLSAAGQEFPKGFVMYLEGHDGMITNFTSAPDLFTAGLRISPQATIIPGHLRLGGTAGAVFNNKKLDGTFGPNLALNLASVNAKNLGSILNVQLQGEYLWGTGKQRLIGGLLNFEIGQFFLVGFSVHRDYALNDWWFQGGLGYNLLRKKRKGIEDPMK